MLLVAALVTTILAPAVALAQSAGAIAGVVTDSLTQTPLAGADVLVDGTALVTATSRTGEFRLSGVPAGEYSLVVSYLGHREERVAVTVTNERAVRLEIKLAPATFSETVQVRAEPMAEGQASALNQQRTALNITNVVSADQIGSFPDPNAAEAASRIPGISIARDQGEGRYVLIRGTEPRLNSVLIDGERIPAPEGDTRQVQLDAVPADQLRAIEVSKAVTPDMDADAIGGAVNLVTKQAVGRPTALFSASGGYNALQRSGDQQLFSGTAGRRFAGGRFGALIGGSSSRLTRGSENFELEYDDGDMEGMELRDYQIDRDRYGLNLSADARVSDNATFVFKGIFNKFQDYEVNNRETFQPGDERIEHVLKNRHQSDTIRSVSGSGQHVLTRAGATLDYRLGWAESAEKQPDRLDTIFRQGDISFSPNVSPTSIDPKNIQPNPSRDNPSAARLDSWETEIFDTRDRDVTASANVRLPLTTSARAATFLKFGAKVKDKRKTNDLEVTEGEPLSDVPFELLRDATFDNSRFLDFFPARYPKFPGIQPDASRALFGGLPASDIEVDHEADAEDYIANETVTAGYAMAEIYVGDKLLFLPGVRYESTKVDYAGNTVIYDDEGDYASTSRVTGGDTHGFFLPGVHVRYAFTTRTNLRAAYTRTLARPNYYDLVPYQLVIQEDQEIERGNPSLRPTTSNNVDVLLEHYLPTVGVISGGFFYKRLHDYIYPFRTREAIFDDRYDVTQPLNGESASLWGAELAFQNQFRSLPAPFDGFGIYANYTWTDSSARFPDREIEATLPGQSTHIGNFAVFYEKYGFSARSSWNFHGKYIDAVGEAAAADVYYDNHTQWDINVSQRVTRHIRAFADFLNLTNAPLRYYQGASNRPIQEEYYRWWTMAGVKVSF
jgi:TonB-dependent receptor